MTRASVTIGQLRDHLSAHLRRVKGGQELVVLDRDRPVARIVAYEAPAGADSVLADLVARGLARAPLEQTDWEAIDRTPRGRIRGNPVLEALLANRDEER